jgi:hypothetical protein
MDHESASAVSPFQAFRKRERHGQTDYPEKEWENHIGESPAMPIGVLEGRVNGAPSAGIVDQEHTCDCGTSKRIE